MRFLKLFSLAMVFMLLFAGLGCQNDSIDELYVRSLYTWNGTAWNQLTGDITASNVSSVYVPYSGAISNVDLNSKEMTNATLNNIVGKGTWTASGTWKLPAMYFNGDITSDRWLSANTNTFFGVSVAGVGGLSHTGGSEGYYNTALGYQAVNSITTGTGNTAFGNASLSGLNDGNYNTAVGSGSMVDLVSGEYNTSIGVFSGHENLGNRNVFIGYRAGYNYTGDDSLYIDNSSTDTPLLGGDFSTNRLDIGGSVNMTTGQQINNLADPTLAQDAATKNYVDTHSWTSNTTAPIDTINPVAWLPVKLPDGTIAYIPAYK